MALIHWSTFESLHESRTLPTNGMTATILPCVMQRGRHGILKALERFKDGATCTVRIANAVLNCLWGGNRGDNGCIKHVSLKHSNAIPRSMVW